MLEQDRLPEDKLVGIPPLIELEIGKNKTHLQLVEEIGKPSILVLRDDNPTIDRITFGISGSLTSENWWLRPELLEQLGNLKEKWELRIGGHSINVYNYWKPLEPERAEEIRVAVAKAASYLPEAVPGLEDIVICGYQEINDKSGNPMNGDWLSKYKYKSFSLFPAAFDMRSSRVTPKISHLTGTTTHELAHTVETSIQNEWRENFGWRFISEGEQSIILPGGRRSLEMCNELERCVTDYAQSDATEDICESFVAYVYDPDRLDSGKRAFMEQRFPHIPEMNKQESWIRLADNKELPGLPENIFYTLRPLKARIIRDS